MNEIIGSTEPDLSDYNQFIESQLSLACSRIFRVPAGRFINFSEFRRVINLHIDLFKAPLFE